MSLTTLKQLFLPSHPATPDFGVGATMTSLGFSTDSWSQDRLVLMGLPFRRRHVLFSATNGVNIVMYRPLFQGLYDDQRVKINHTGSLSHTRGFEDHNHTGMRWFFSQHGIHHGVMHFRVARYFPFDIYISPNYSQRIIPRFAKLKIQVFHGVSFKNCALNPKSAEFDRLFLPGPYHRRRFIELGIFEEGDPRLRMTGLPKLDRLVDGSLDRTEILEFLNLDPDLPTVLYAPTGDIGNSLNRHGEEIISTLLNLPINLIIKPHDHPSLDEKCGVDWNKKLRSMTHERLRTDLGSDIVPLLAAADLLITDASSVAFEFCLVNRPIIFFDVPEIFDGPRKEQMDLDTWGRKGGDIVTQASELEDRVLHLLENPEEKAEIRQAIAKDIFFDPGHATDRAMTGIYADLELSPPGALNTELKTPVG